MLRIRILDPGSVAFRTLDPVSEIRDRDPKWVKIQDPESGINLTLDPGSGIKILDPQH
jgi:hypothetical protein